MRPPGTGRGERWSSKAKTLGRVTTLLGIWSLAAAGLAQGPIGHWVFRSDQINGSTVTDLAGGRDATILGPVEVDIGPLTQSLRLDGYSNWVNVADDLFLAPLPVREMTIEVWVNIMTPLVSGGIIGVAQDDGGAQKGWWLCYDQARLGFVLSTTGADDGDGLSTRLRTSTNYTPRQWTHLAATFDGVEMKIYLNGSLSNSSFQQWGDILYPSTTFYVIGAFHDATERYEMDGLIKEAKVYDRVLSPQEIEADFLLDQALTQAVEPAPTPLPGIETPLIANGLGELTQVTSAGDGSGRLFVVERHGKIQIIHPGGFVQQAPFLDITQLVSDAIAEEGLFAVAFHPQYASNGRFFVHYTRRGASANINQSIIAEYAVSGDPNFANTQEKIILAGEPHVRNHNGGLVTFGPDGYLYAGFGDGQNLFRSQMLSDLFGTLIRIDIDNPPAGQTYGIPPDNPFVNDGDPNTLGEIYAYGLRNPWRFSFDPPTGRLFLGDVGGNVQEEIDLIESGDNYGWGEMEADLCQFYNGPCQPNLYRMPIHDYPNAWSGASVVGGEVYRGQAYPNFYGQYFFADYWKSLIWILRPFGQGEWRRTLIADRSGSFITSFGHDDAGELYYCTQQGGVYQIVDTRPSFPEIWVDFNWTGAELGTVDFPVNTFGEAHDALELGGTVKIMAGSTDETPRLTKPMRIEAIGGAVRIGGGMGARAAAKAY